MTTQAGGTPGRERHGADYEEFVSGVYLEAVRQGDATRQGLRETGLTDHEVTQATTELVVRGFLLAGDDPDTWQVVSPREAFPRHLQMVEHRAALTRATIAELDDEWRRARGRGVLASLPDLHVLSSLPEIVDRMVSMHQVTQDRLWWVVDASRAAVHLLRRAESDADLLDLPGRADVRLVLDTELLAEDAAHTAMERARRAGHAVRVGHGVPFGAMVCDDQSVLVDISTYDPDGYGSLELRREPARRAVTALVEQVWSLSTPFALTARTEAERDEGPPLDERDQRVLALLATGASDQLIARQTGVSVRTVERRVRYLTEHLGAATRFQAGVQAVRRGWV